MAPGPLLLPTLPSGEGCLVLSLCPTSLHPMLLQQWGSRYSMNLITVGTPLVAAPTFITML